MLLSEYSNDSISESSTTSITMKKEKVLRFADKTTTIMCIEEAPEAHNVNDKWFSKEDFENIERAKQTEIKHCKKLCLDLLLENTFEDPCEKSRLYLESLTRFCGSRMDDEQQCYLSFCPRGLEKCLSRQHADERSSIKKRCIQGVLARQKLMKRRQTMGPSDIWLELSSFSRNYSRPARKFARCQGKADEHAATQEGNNDDFTMALHLIKKVQKCSLEVTCSAPLNHTLPSTRILGGGKSSRNLLAGTHGGNDVGSPVHSPPMKSKRGTRHRLPKTCSGI